MKLVCWPIIVILVSCLNWLSKNGNNQKLNNNKYQVENNNINTEEKNQNINYSEQIKEETTLKENNHTENKTVENSYNDVYNSTDREVINYFNKIETDIDNELKKGNNQTVKDKLKGTFIIIVDFLFYDSDINGIKFNYLTEGAKQNVLQTVSSIDNKIMSKYPNYKEEISVTTKSAYNKASELIQKGADNVKEFSKEKLGEENYNSIIEAKDELVHYIKEATNIIGNIAGNIWNTSKSKIKSWYEKFKN